MKTATMTRSLFAELDELTDRELHERIKPARPPFVSPKAKGLAELKARHTVAPSLPLEFKRRLELHAAHPGCLLLFRIGDFYELFDENARTAAALCGLTVTTRHAKGEPDTPMAGFPYHQLENYLNKLIRSGQRVAICEATP